MRLDRLKEFRSRNGSSRKEPLRFATKMYVYLLPEESIAIVGLPG